MLLLFTAAIMLVVGYFYFREGVLTAIAMTVNVFVAGLVTYNFYEPIAAELEGMFAGSFLAGYEDALCQFLLFALALGVLRVITHNLANTELELPALPQQIVATLFGLVCGYLLAGFLVCLFQTLPWSEKFMGFDHQVDPNASKFRRVLPPDRVWLALMHRGSTGPLAHGSPFDPDGSYELRHARLRRLRD